MPIAVRLAFLCAALAVFASACLDFAPATTNGGTPTATPAPTIEPPTPTATQPPPTPTSTVTPTPTVTPTVTSTPFGLVTDPRTGLVTVPTFAPPSGQVIPPPSLPAPVVPPPLVSQPPPIGPVAPVAPVSSEWGCDGDERMEFVPPNPSLGQKLFIFVTGSRDRAFGLMIGPGLSGVQGTGVAGGSSGLKKMWELIPEKAGTYTYQFYGGPFPEMLCVTGSFTVGGTGLVGLPAGPPATSTPTPTATPTGTPRPDH